MWKKIAKDYLNFNRKDRIGLFCVLGLIAGVIFLPRLFSKGSQSFPVKQDSVLVKAIDTLETAKELAKNNKYNRDDNYTTYQYEPTQREPAFKNGELFQFDPNTASEDDWKRLGLNAKTSATIVKYRSKGGKFYKPEDLLKIWGMPEEFYDRVKGYISITSTANNYNQYSQTSSKPVYEKQERKISAFDINQADTSAFIALPGIGSKLSARIVNFREKLGGFYSVNQIGETYGLPDSTFQKLKPYFNVNSANIRKINVNTATKDELKSHPYIRWNLANAIVEYRSQHGNFKSMDDLKNITLITDDIYSKVAPYLILQ